MGRTKDDTTKIFAFSFLSQTALEEDPDLADNPYMFEMKCAKASATSMDKQIDGEVIHPRNPLKAHYEKKTRNHSESEYYDEEEEVDSDESGSEYEYEEESLADMALQALNVMWEKTYLLLLMLGTIGLLLGSNVGICVVIMFASYEKGKQTVKEAFHWAIGGLKKKKRKNLSHVFGRAVLHRKLGHRGPKNDEIDLNENLSFYRRFAEPTKRDGPANSKLRGIKMSPLKIAEVMCYVKDEAAKDEVKITNTQKRAKIDIEFCGGAVRKLGLIDTGAESCLIDRETIEEIKRTGTNVTRVATRFSVQGIIPGSENEDLECVLLDIKLGGKVILPNVPFIVMDIKQILIGVNVMKA